MQEIEPPVDNPDYSSFKSFDSKSFDSKSFDSFLTAFNEEDSRRLLLASESKARMQGAASLKNLPELQLENRGAVVEAVVQRVAFQAKERTIDIKDADSIFGWWQKKEYEKIGATKVTLGENYAALDLKAPYHKNAIVAKLDLERSFSFHFNNKNNQWILNDVHGLKVNGSPVDRAEATASGISFWSGNKRQDFGKAARDYMKSLLDPLMRADLRR